MSRRNAAVKRPVLPDPQFNSRLASMMISRLMKHGKKSTAQKILSDAFSLISERAGGNAVELFEKSLLKPIKDQKILVIGGGAIGLICALILEKVKKCNLLINNLL